MKFMINTAKLKIKRGTPIYVIWLDAVGHSNGWVTEEEAEEASRDEEWEVKQLGFMFECTKEYISMCASINEGEKKLLPVH